jgi:hypothetical protein
MDLHVPPTISALYVAADGRVDTGYRWDPRRPTAILPGAFNPVHAGHWGLAAAAADVLELPVAFELSIANVDKPPLAPCDVHRRAAQLTGRTALWLTEAPRFVEKAELFPGAVFVVGADTACRIVDPRYYVDSEQMQRALRRIGELSCRFVVACRVDAAGRCVTLADIPVPPPWCGLFSEISFRLDLSSTQIRERETGTTAQR